MTFWNSIKDSRNPADFREYIDKYPDGEFAGVARRRLDSLEATLRAEATAPAREKAAKPANVFELRHAHQSFRTLRFATATVTVTAQGVRYSEVGQDAKSDHNLSFSCAEFKEAKFETFRNAQELKDIVGFGLQDAVKLSLEAAGKLDQAFTERDVAEAMLVAIRDSCGIKTSTSPSSRGWAIKPSSRAPVRPRPE